VKEHKINSQYDFVQGYYMNDLSICDYLINLHKTTKTVAGFSGNQINKNKKDSTDLILRLQETKFYQELNLYFEEQENALNIYKTKYKYCNSAVSKWKINDNFNVQKYKPSQGYHAWHCERGSLKNSNRHLVWMTFLNDIKQGGETEFYYQKLKVKPEKGLTLFFPSDWTFTHKGNTTIDEDKYIITGWYHLVK
tara:strand:- start:506 stop:1087 length:582 start_codon:yes stop_codon:yes gene_type:complete